MASASSKVTLNELNAWYTAADAVDREVFAEMRSNILLVAGEHYSKAAIGLQRAHIRENRDLADIQKLRLTKNHIHKVHRRYVQAIMTYASGTTISPQTENEMQDQKAAELNLSVWKDAQYRYKLRAQIRNWVADFVDVGEVAVKIFWDQDAGDFVGYAHKQAPEGGKVDPNHVANEQGFLYEKDSMEPVADEASPIFAGGFVFERLFGFNLLRDAGCKDFEASPSIGVRKMVETAKLKAKYKNQPEKLGFLEKGQNEEFIIFDATRNGYDRAKGMTLVKERYWKPGVEFPNGYYCIYTSGGILEEDELPFGFFPICWKGFDEHQTAPRGRSIIKQARPFQAEINRASSQQAQAQITIGDDKILYSAGSKLAPGALLPGVRGISYQGGKEPTILPGRDGSQFLNYILSQIDEMDKVLDIESLDDEKSGTQDPFTQLFRSARQREKFSLYSEKFEEFLVEVTKLFLELAKKYYPDDMLIPAISAKEYVNMAEFRSTVALHYRIHVEPQDDTMETKFGKQLTIQHVLQYASGNLDKDDIGKLVRNMPFANFEEEFGDLTIDYDIAKNDMLALERGEFRPAHPEDNQVYMIKKLSFRMRQPDFAYLRPEIQKLYQIKKQQHLQLKAQEEQKIIDAKNEYIPTDGPLLGCDMYVPNPDDPAGVAKRARIPQSALNWLLKTLEAQGQSQQELESMDQATMAQMAGYLQNKAQGMGQGQPQAPGAFGQARPMGIPQ